MIFDPMYLVFIIPPLLLSLWATFRVKSNFNKYSRVRSARGMTGAQVAEQMLRQAGIQDVQVTRARGFLSDHYNPSNKTLALSQGVYDSTSVAAVSVAAHEAGHALQHDKGYAPLHLRTALVPTASIGSSLGYGIMFFGWLFSAAGLIYLGALLFSAVLLFQVVTLPVEFDASSRAKQILFNSGLIMEQERRGVSKVLNAAALTYVAAVVSSLMTLLYFLMAAGRD
ncbi:MAG TPA: zinc metallopeptidase [Acidobacteriota bacterium]|nr:zinc metallopeptidase [Acidobacteriota bacterium]